MQKQRKRKKREKEKEKKKREKENNEVLLRLYESFIPQNVEERRKVFESAESLIKQLYRGARVYQYGSSGGGTELKDSDIDICIHIYTFNERKVMSTISDELERNEAYDEVELWWSEGNDRTGIAARHVESHLLLDITINDPEAPMPSTFFESLTRRSKTCKQLLVLLKKFFQVQGLHLKYEGSIPSIVICYLGIFYLQHCKAVPLLLQNERLEIDVDFDREASSFENTPFNDECNKTLSELLSGLFRYYSVEVDFDQYAICLRTSTLIRKEEIDWPHAGGMEYHMAILDPFRIAENLNKAHQVEEKDLKRMISTFEQAQLALQKGRAEELFQSVLVEK